MAESLAWLRPIDSIWWAWVQRYLLAADIPKMDLFHWSEDTTNLPAALVRDLLELTLDNKLTKPDALETLGAPVDLGEVEGSRPTCSPGAPTTSPPGAAATAPRRCSARSPASCS